MESFSLKSIDHRHPFYGGVSTRKRLVDGIIHRHSFYYCSS